MLALKYYHLYTTRPGWFVPRYVALLKNGFDAPPAELLEHFLEIDLLGTALLDDGVTILGRRLGRIGNQSLSVAVVDSRIATPILRATTANANAMH